MKKVVFLVLMFFISSCAITGNTAKEQKQKEMVQATKQQCEDQGRVYQLDPTSGTSSCTDRMPDAGKRCTKTADCEGYCQGSNESTSSGTCSLVKKPLGCVLLIERGERFERCFS